MTKRIFISADHGMAIVRDESLAHAVQALRASPKDFHELRQGFIPLEK